MIFSVDFIDKSTKYEVIIFVKNNKIITYNSIKNYQKREKTNLKQKFRVVDFRIQWKRLIYNKGFVSLIPSYNAVLILLCYLLINTN